jgi:hypothetical protein
MDQDRRVLTITCKRTDHRKIDCSESNKVSTILEQIDLRTF